MAVALTVPGTSVALPSTVRPTFAAAGPVITSPVSARCPRRPPPPRDQYPPLSLTHLSPWLKHGVCVLLTSGRKS
eukprot:COSAG01_NODE_916_length_12760_cov_13.023379_4_plen_75_part_00